MKQGRVSTLNPYAACYVPLSKRESAEQIEIPALLTSKHHTSQNKQPERSSCSDNAALETHSPHGFLGSSSSSQNPEEPADEQTMNEEFDILEFLRMSFPGMSDESINDVYLASDCDLEATMDMLHHLEFDTFESPENLPDSLDIGDVSELNSLAECSSVKLKNVAGEASASSSGSPASESVITS